MTGYRLLVVALLLVTVFSTGFAGDVASPQILVPGECHGEETSAVSGEAWFALTNSSGASSLSAVTLKVETCFDAVLDDEKKGEKSGKKISVVEPVADILFLIRGIPALSAGNVESVASDIELKPNTPVACRLAKGPDCFLEWSCPGLLGKGPASASRLLIRLGSSEQELATGTVTIDNDLAMVGDASSWQLLWAGDLNRDGIPDLILDLADHYNLFLPTLFLSEGTPEKPLLKKAAVFLATGC